MKECADNIHTLRTDSSICVDCGFDCGTEVTSSPPIQDLTIREILDDFYVSTHKGRTYANIHDGDIDEKDAEEAEHKLTQLLLRERIDELKTISDKIANYKPSPTAPRLGSASGAFENAGWKNYCDERISALTQQLKKEQ